MELILRWVAQFIIKMFVARAKWNHFLKWHLTLTTLFFTLFLSTCTEAVVNGTSAIKAEFPFAASICSISGEHFNHDCSGTIISKHFVLTAAHCIQPTLRQFFVVFVGSRHRQKGTPHSIEKVHVPKSYNSLSMYDDIALLQLTNPIIFSPKIASIPLNPNYIGDDLTAIVIGWGAELKVKINIFQFIRINWFVENKI